MIYHQKSFLSESGFVFHEADKDISMRLTKTVGDKEVIVVFDAR